MQIWVELASTVGNPLQVRMINPNPPVCMADHFYMQPISGLRGLLNVETGGTLQTTEEAPWTWSGQHKIATNLLKSRPGAKSLRATEGLPGHCPVNIKGRLVDSPDMVQVI